MNEEERNKSKEASGANRTYKTNGAYRADEAYRANEAYRTQGAYGAYKADRKPLEPQPFLPKKGNYRGLIVYQKAECIYDITFYFAHHYFVERKARIAELEAENAALKARIVELEGQQKGGAL